MDGGLQKKLIPLFHYALNPGGFLFLGTSETVGDYTDLFTSLDRKMKIYQRKQDIPGQRITFGRYLPAITPMDVELLPQPTKKIPSQGKLSLRQMSEQALLEQVVPASALVNEQGDILYIHGRTGNIWNQSRAKLALITS